METTIQAAEIIDGLKAGNSRFLEGRTDNSPGLSLKKLQEFARTGQFPKAIVLCCSDSRAPVELIFDQGIGDLFVIRVAGNVVAPSLVGSIEFAASAYATKLVLVMGHTHCGAVTATLDYIEGVEVIASENLHDLISRIKPHIYKIAKLPELTHDEKLTRAIEANVRASVDQLASSSRVMEKLIQQQKITIIGAVLDLDTGRVRFLDA